MTISLRHDLAVAHARIAELERENAALRAQLATAREGLKKLAVNVSCPNPEPGACGCSGDIVRVTLAALSAPEGKEATSV